ncbi:tetratricopeptide repeat protein [Nonomuraea sp. M3C6]|uniref:Tetratricopeptide repeat protein n=1 Tax=Nonomuraea marmarensis TaxID=3351344 RepID=A0ABW7AQP8_9ACTN
MLLPPAKRLQTPRLVRRVARSLSPRSSPCRSVLPFLELGDHRGRAHTLASLGYIHHQLGRHQRAVRRYHSSLGLFREIGDQYNEAETLIRLGEALHAGGDADASQDIWRQALAIVTEIDFPHADRLLARLGRDKAGGAGAR